MADRLRLKLEVAGNLDPLDSFLAKMKQAEDQMNRLKQLGKDDGIQSLLGGLFGASLGGGGIGKAGGSIGGFLGGPIGGVIGAAVGKAVGAISDAIVATTKGIGNLVLDFGKKVVDSAAYRQDSVLALSKFTGSEASAKREFDLNTRIADKTIFGTQDIVDLTKRLYVSGFKENQVSALRGRGLDIGSLYGGTEGKEVLKEFTASINKIAGKGKYTAEVEQGDLIEKRLGVKSVRLAIAEQLGLKGTEKSILDQVAKLIKKGKVDDVTAINAIEDAIGKKTGGGASGAFAKEAAFKSISGAISNVQDAFSNSLLRIDWDNSPGIQAFTKFLRNLSDVLGSPEVNGVIKELTESIFKGFEDIHKEDIIRWVEKFEGAVLSLKPAIEETWNSIRKIISGQDGLLGGLVTGFAKVAGIIGNILVAAVLDAAVGGSKHLDSALEKYRNEQADKAAKQADEDAGMANFQEYKKKRLAERAIERVNRGEGNFVEQEEKKGFNMVKHVYNVKVDARGKGKNVMKEINGATETARLAAGR